MNEIRSRNRKIASIGIILAAAMLISGCAVGPDFQKPDAPTPEGWLETAEASINTDASDHREWWKSFGDPALEALIERAYAENQALEIAGLRVYEARAQLGFAKGTLYPQVMSARLSADDIELSKNAEPVSILPPPVAPLGSKPGIAGVETFLVKATVESLNLTDRIATLRYEDGSMRTIKVADDVPLDLVNVGDEVRFRITKAVAVSVRKANSS